MKSYEIGDRFSVNNQYPAIATDGIHDIVVWEESRNGRGDRIMLLAFKDGRPESDALQVSGEGLGLRPAAISVGEIVWIAWSEFINGSWRIAVRPYSSGVLGETVIVEEGDALFYVSLSSIAGDVAVLYNRQGPGRSEVRMAMGKDGFSPETVSISSKCYRPSAAYDGRGNILVAYDAFDGRSYGIYARAFSSGSWSDEVRLDVDGRRCAHPVAVSPSEGLFVICWYENDGSSYYSYNAADCRIDGGKIVLSDERVVVENRGWYNNVAASAGPSGDTIFCYTVGRNMLASIRKADGSWGSPSLLSYDDGCGGIRPKAIIGNDGSVRYVWQWTNKNGHMDRHAVIVYGSTSLAEMAARDDSAMVNELDRFTLPIPGDKSLSGVSEDARKEWLRRHGIDGELLFGDIHGQSNMSDGMGELDQYYHYAMVDSRMDFCALTDHDCYPDEATEAEWEWNRATRNIFNEEKDFSVLLAFEWTSNEYNHDFGHKNVYYPSSEGGIYQCTTPEGLNPDRLYASIRKDGGLCIPHHPAADWGHVSAATDWDYSSDVQRAVEIFSRHADYEKTETSSRYTKNIAKFPHKCAQDALQRGYRLGFVAGSDSHQMEHGKEGGILGAFVGRNTSQEVWSAIWNRHTYGTTGARILLSFRMGEAFMGDEAAWNGERAFTAAVLAPDEIRKIEIIRNGDVIYSIVPDSRDVDLSFTDAASASSDWYYLRVEQADDQVAWSSPIFVN